MSQFSEKINKLLVSQEKKQSDFVRAFGLKPAVVSHWFNGLNNPDYETLKKFSQFFNVSIDYLLDNNVCKVKNNDNFVKIPILNWIQAGVMTDIMEIQTIDFVSVSSELKHCFALRVQGDSMTPVFQEDDIIIVDPTREPVTGNYVVAVTENNEKATFKKYRERYTNKGEKYFELIPLNTDYPSFNSLQFGIIIKGVVIKYDRKVI